MAPSSDFFFQVPSDEERSEEEVEEEEEEEEEETEDESDDETEQGRRSTNKKSQSPWDFGAYSETVGDEHARRNTTSIDFKISKVLQNSDQVINHPVEEASSDSESDRQEEYRSEEDDDAGGAAEESTPFFSSSEGTSFNASSFIELNLSRPLLKACEELGYKKPTPIQSACIPLALTGRDICGSAMTGSGKTAAFSLPTLERLLYRPKGVKAIRVLILTPTRELAVQVHSMVEKLAQFTDIRCCLVVGGLSTKVQESALRSQPDIVVATPGRMIDHLRNSMSVDLDDLAVLILDEADRLLELGFNAEIHELVRACPKRRQTMLFSATMTEEVDELIRLSLTKPLRLSADPSSKRPATLTEEIVKIRRMREMNQEAVLLALCTKTFKAKVIIFSGTKQAAHRLKILFGLAGLKAAELHGNLTQVQRLDALEQFKKQEVDYLISTDVAARGLDILGVQTVINYACPRDITSYVHRVGRTARAGREGYAVTFVTENERSLLKAIAKRAGSKLKSRIVAEQSIIKWSKAIEEMESQVSAVLREEREEMAMRKAEMEVRKATNLIIHRDDIFSRPKRTWFVTEREKKLTAKTAKVSLEKGKGSKEEVVSAEQAEDLKMKEKRKREREKNLPRKKRRKLEAAREMLEDDENDNTEGKKSLSLVDVAYRRAKAAKAAQRAVDAGKIVKKPKSNNDKKPKRSYEKTQSRSDEMHDLFQGDMSDRKSLGKKKTGTGGSKKSSKFKSKSSDYGDGYSDDFSLPRYKRR